MTTEAGGKPRPSILRAADALITPERIRAYSLILLIGYAAGIAVLLATLRHGLDPRGKPAFRKSGSGCFDKDALDL